MIKDRKLSGESDSTNSTDASEFTYDLTRVSGEERKRYKSKGYGLVVGFLTTCAYFYYCPIIAKNYWP